MVAALVAQVDTASEVATKSHIEVWLKMEPYGVFREVVNHVPIKTIISQARSQSREMQASATNP